MRYSKYFQNNQVSVFNQDGSEYCAKQGEINGLLHIQGFTDPQRHCTRDSGFLRLTFGFADAAGETHTYLVLLSPFGLWPTPGTQVRPASTTFKKEVTNANVVLDTRDLPSMRYANGSELRSAHKYNDTTWQFRADESSLAVRLTVYIGDQTSGRQESYVTVEYDIPLEQLLWRKAPKYADDEVSPESEPYVWIKRIGKLSDPGVPKELKPSPIIVTSPTVST